MMKKTSIIIALSSFFAGLVLAAFVFVYTPKSDTQPADQISGPKSEISTNLYAAEPRMSQMGRPDQNFAEIAERISPAVVYIVAEKVEKVQSRSFFDNSFEDFWKRFFNEPESQETERRSTTSGTGFFIGADGYVVTNNHVVEKAVAVTVTLLNGKDYKAEVIGTDEETDLALIRIKGDDFPYTNFGNSDALKVGEWVVAIGNPLGLNHTVTAGIVSAKGRLFPQEVINLTYQDFIQTDAAINRGNSGGPLLNMAGEVIGINTLIFGPGGGNIGIGFAISSDLANKVIDQLKEEGRVVRGYLGVSVLAVEEDTMDILQVDEAVGAYILSVEADSPADKVNLQKYDVIIGVNGEPVKDPVELTFKVAEIKPGSKVGLDIIRDGKKQTLQVKIGEKNAQEITKTEEASGTELGLGVDEMTPRIARRFGYQTTEGLVITEIKPNSEADKKGLRQGDLILEADKKKLESVSDLEKIIDKKKPGQVVLLQIRREGGRGGSQDFIVTLRIPE